MCASSRAGFIRRLGGAAGFALLLLLAVVLVPGATHAEEAGQALRPRVRILSPADGASVAQNEVIFTLAVPRSRPQGSWPPHVYIDNQPAQLREVSGDRGAIFPTDRPSVPVLSQAEELRRVQVAIPSRDCAVAFSLEADGPPARIFLKWAGSQVDYIKQPKLYVLAIGVGAYSGTLQPLRYPAKDARDFAAAFQAQQGRLYNEVVSYVLTDSVATRENILERLALVRREMTQHDVAVVLLAGHGINEPGFGKYHFVPYRGNPANPESSLISGDQIISILSQIPGKVLFFLDTCHAGNVVSQQVRDPTTEIDRFISELQNAGSALIIFAASTGRQLSKENDAWQNGAFTKAIVEGIRGAASHDGAGRITISTLDYYVTNKVKELTQGTQTPATAKPAAIPDFPLALAPSADEEAGAAARKKPIYKRWWFWTALGGAAAVTIGLAVGLSLRNQCPPRLTCN